MNGSVVETRVREMIKDLKLDAEHPDYNALRKYYKERYGRSTNKMTLERAYTRLASNGLVSRPARRRRANRSGVRGVPGNLRAVHEAAQECGGYDKAIAIAELIASMGGIRRFARAVEMLKMVKDATS